MIWVYFLIGLKVDWLSNSKHPLFFFYLKIQPGESLPFLNCFANWLLREVITSAGDGQLSACSVSGGGAEDPRRPWRDGKDGPLPEQGLTHAHFRICALTSILRPRGRVPVRGHGGHWLLFWPTLRGEALGYFPELQSQAQGWFLLYQSGPWWDGSRFRMFILFPWTESLHPVSRSRHPFHVALVICLLVLRPTHSSPLSCRGQTSAYYFPAAFANWPQVRLGQLKKPGEAGGKWVELFKWGCHNRGRQTGWLKTTETYSFSVLAGGSLKSRWLAGLCSPWIF